MASQNTSLINLNNSAGSRTQSKFKYSKWYKIIVKLEMVFAFIHIMAGISAFKDNDKSNKKLIKRIEQEYADLPNITHINITMVGGSILMVPISKDFDPLGYRSSTTGDIIPGRDFLRKLRGLPCSQQIPTCVMYVMVGIYICLTASSIPAGYFVLTRALNLVPEESNHTQLRDAAYSCLLFGTIYLLTLLSCASLFGMDYMFPTTPSKVPWAKPIPFYLVGIFVGFHLAYEAGIHYKKLAKNDIELTNLRVD
ncbi:uncharacterized protein LOC110855442 isoform X2 [Folsomia candida]|uniref:uncharacterized protein LOC110855442 isoform X2 n=1 Tax=Folsomia candida TaxID=158441 RepID=UPI001604E777|nr:uncharacterized protein LOC110855442 isoform X2 [Folsomia candida]